MMKAISKKILILFLFMVFAGACPIILAANKCLHSRNCPQKDIQIIKKEIHKLMGELHYLNKKIKESQIEITDEEAKEKFKKLYDQLELIQKNYNKLREVREKIIDQKISYLKNKISFYLNEAHRKIENNGERRKAESELPERQEKTKEMNKFISNPYKVFSSLGPANDDCVNAFIVSEGIYYGDTSTATQDGSSSCYSPAPDVWYKYTPTQSGVIIIDTTGSSYDTVLSVHANCPGTTENELICNDDCTGLTSCIYLNAQVGNSYIIRVSGFGSSSGSYTLNINLPGRFKGTITDSLTSLPLSNVRVEIYNSQGYYVGAVYSDYDGNYESMNLLPGIYYALTETSLNYIDELYNNIPCENYCTPTNGTPINVNAGEITTGIDFALDPGGKISGYVYDALTGLPIKGASVSIYNSSGQWVDNPYTDSLGFYITDYPLATGNYYAKASTYYTYLSELYDNILCYPDCNPITGTPISVSIGQTTSNINFILDRGGAIAGSVTEAITNNPLDDSEVEVYDSNGDYITSAWVEYTGNYITDEPLLPGSYYALTSTYGNYIDELYDNFTCEPNCNPTSGTAIPANINQITQNINFQLNKGGSISGIMVESATNEPIGNGWINIYDANGNFVTYAGTNSSGYYITENAPLLTGNYFALTDTYYFNCYIDELYDNIPCESGCNVTSGTPIPVVVGSNTPNINFALDTSINLFLYKPEVNDAASSSPNGIIETDETVELKAIVENTCWLTIDSATGTLTSTDPIIINDPNAIFYNIGYGTYYCDDCYYLTAPSQNRPQIHWDIKVTEDIDCPGCNNTPEQFTYHIGNSFQDVPVSNIFYSYIETLLHNSITGGCDINNYCPSLYVDRQQMAKFICSGMNPYCLPYCSYIFEDVPITNPFCGYIVELYNIGIVGGCQSNPLLYCPNDLTQRQQMAKFICLAMDYAGYGWCNTYYCGGIFSDVDSSNPFCPYIESLYDDNIIGGCAYNTFCPQNYVSREQMAKFIVNAFALEL